MSKLEIRGGRKIAPQVVKILGGIKGGTHPVLTYGHLRILFHFLSQEVNDYTVCDLLHIGLEVLTTKASHNVMHFRRRRFSTVGVNHYCLIVLIGTDEQ